MGGRERFRQRNAKMLPALSGRRIPHRPGHLAPPRADYEQVFAGANFNTEKISGAHVEVSGAHFKALAIIKVSGAPLEASLKSPEHNLMK